MQDGPSDQLGLQKFLSPRIIVFTMQPSLFSCLWCQPAHNTALVHTVLGPACPAHHASSLSRHFPMQLQATAILCVGILGWTLSGLRRRRERIRLQAAGYGSFLQQCAGMRAAACTPAGALPAGSTKPAAVAASGKHQHEPVPACATTANKPAAELSHNSSSSSSRSIYPVFKSSCVSWPPLAVILPVKGCRPHSIQNWSSQLSALYGEGDWGPPCHTAGD